MSVVGNYRKLIIDKYTPSIVVLYMHLFKQIILSLLVNVCYCVIIGSLHELEDDLSDLLDEVGRISDAATVSLRCKRSPRRSASARELLLAGGSVPVGPINSVPTTQSSIAGRSSINRNGWTMGQQSKNSDFSISVVPSGGHVEKQKCHPIYLSGVIDSIDANQAVRYRVIDYVLMLSNEIFIEYDVRRVCNSLRCTGCDFRVGQFA